MSGRRRVPPGGEQTFHFGDEPVKAMEHPRLYGARMPIPAPPSPLKPEVAPLHTVQISSTLPVRIAIAIAKGTGSDLVLSETEKSLRQAGISGLPVTEVLDPLMLPFTIQSLLQKNEVVIALALITNDGIGSGSMVQTLLSSLMNISAQSSAPIVPGIFSPSSLLEPKTLLPELSAKWAAMTVAFIESKYGHFIPPLPPAPPALVITPAIVDIATLLLHFQESLKKHGAKGIFGLARKFRIMDDDNSGKLSLDEFTKGVKELDLSWSVIQTKAVFDSFDTDHVGGISYNEFLRGARGEINENRKQLVLQAFEILDKDKSGSIEVEEIKSRYNTSKHPDVISGKKTSEEVLLEFLHTFDGHNDGTIAHRNAPVTFSDFLEYYNNISASIDRDDYFELMMRNAWHISGGHGWSENTTCRRVLVTHSDSSETVEEVKNDLGLGADIEAITVRLRAQGIKDIVKVTL